MDEKCFIGCFKCYAPENEYWERWRLYWEAELRIYSVEWDPTITF